MDVWTQWTENWTISIKKIEQFRLSFQNNMNNTNQHLKYPTKINKKKQKM